MRYPASRKDHTRARIVAAASRGFRAHGLTGLGVAAVMGEIGLTHGGFYAHFAGKDALVIEACRRALAESWRPFEGLQGPPAVVVRDIATSYLSAAHRAGRAGGCVIAALGPEIARSEPAVRRAVAAEVEARLARLGTRMPGGTARRRKDAATLLMATLVGTLLLSRLLPEREGLRSLTIARRLIAQAARDTERRVTRTRTRRAAPGGASRAREARSLA